MSFYSLIERPRQFLETQRQLPQVITEVYISLECVISQGQFMGRMREVSVASAGESG